MNGLVTTVRVLAILERLFLLSTSFIDLLGLMPYSNAPPTLAERVFSTVSV